MDTTPEGMLAEVNNAIYTIMITGQEYRFKDRYLRRADISMLHKMKKEPETQISASNSQGLMDNTYAVVFDRR